MKVSSENTSFCSGTCRKKRSVSATFVWILALSLLGGCASTSLFDAQQQFRQSFINGNLDQSEQLIQQFAARNIYRSNDQVLLNLELGALHYYRGEHEQSKKRFQEAELEIDRLFGISVERNLRAILLNDAQLEYQGEDYEDVMINLFNALSSIHLNNMEAALVETRRASFKLENLAIRYDGIVDGLLASDTTNVKSAQWSRGSANIQESVFGHYLSYLIYDSQGRTDYARIEFERFKRAHRRNFPNRSWEPFMPPAQRGTQNTLVAEQPAGAISSAGISARRETHPPAGNVLLLAFGGRAPSKQSEEIRIYSSDLSTYIKYAAPRLQSHSSAIHYAEAVIADSLVVPLPMLDDFSSVANDVFNVRRPLIITRAIIRSTLKYTASQTAQHLARREMGETAGNIAGILGFIFTEVSEVADLRSWQTMPGKVYGQSVLLPEGTHQVQIRYYGANRRLLFQEESQVSVTPDRDIIINEAFFWN
ncbi:MAG: hypothetical protein LAT67_08835 [Balneolales bacterium]|nr:hypothetical protein [Balneolales bacterium]